MAYLLALGLLMGTLAADEPGKAAVKPKDDAPATEKASTEKDDGPSPQKIMEEVNTLLTELREIEEADDAGKAKAIKLIRKIIDRTGEIVKLNPPGRVFQQAAQLHILGYREIVARGDDADEADATKALTALKDHDNQMVAGLSQQILDSLPLARLPRLSPSQREKLVDSILEKVKSSKFSSQSLRAASELGGRLDDIAGYDAAGYYERLAEMIDASGDLKLSQQSDRFKGTARRLRLMGNTMDVKGNILGAKEIDWSAYKGKVVLVEYWATWCGPCIQELPNVKRLYKEHHEQGFDVVGISLDSDPKKLTDFLAKEEIPWTILFEENEKTLQGWNHPMARHYGISGIPTCVLVGRDGKVVSLNARGKALETELKKQLGK